MKPQTFFVPGPLPGMNEIIGAAKGMSGRGILYAKMKREWGATIELAIVMQHIKPVASNVFLTFTWREKGRRRDPDNVAAGKKFVVDGLVGAGILKNDGWDQISGFQDLWEVDKDNPGVLVEMKG